MALRKKKKAARPSAKPEARAATERTVPNPVVLLGESPPEPPAPELRVDKAPSPPGAPDPRHVLCEYPGHGGKRIVYVIHPKHRDKYPAKKIVVDVV